MSGYKVHYDQELYRTYKQVVDKAMGLEKGESIEFMPVGVSLGRARVRIYEYFNFLKEKGVDVKKEFQVSVDEVEGMVKLVRLARVEVELEIKG